MVRKITRRPLQTDAQVGEMMGRAFRATLFAMSRTPALGSAPYSRISAQTLGQALWSAGYEAALQDVRDGKRRP